MRKISLVIVLVAGFLTTVSFLGVVNIKADDNAVADNQVLNDEGYGNEDAEYYNSEDDLVNDQEPSMPRDYSSNDSSGNDAQ